jgi:hypothetical protein
MEKPEELESGVKGKQGELRVFGKLLEHGFSVYQPMVDTGIDCIIDVGNGNYKEIQIKSRTKTPFFLVKKTPPRDNLFIICYLMSKPELWVIPSRVFLEEGSRARGRIGKDYIRLAIGSEGSASYEALREYRDNFTLLTKGASAQVKKAVERAHRRIAGKHFRQADYEHEILRILSKWKSPLSTSQIIQLLKERLGELFSEADLAKISGGRVRWEATARFAIYQGLKKKGLIESKGKNQWVITRNGLTSAGQP